jgi:hypothetical protein
MPAGTAIYAAAAAGWERDVRRVFICGAPPGSGVVLGQAQQLGPTAHVYLDGHFPTVNVKPDGVRMQVSYAGSWFGDGDYTPEQAELVWFMLGNALRHEWKDDSAGLLMSPATTGRDLFLRTVPAEGFPVLGDDVQTFIRSVAGGGRTETMPAASRLMPALYEYDARLAYFACMDRRLPIGEPEEHAGGAALRWVDEHPYMPCKVLAEWIVPEADRGRPGILPVKLGEQSWEWPRDGLHAGWIDGAELFTARKWGWPVKVHRVIGWTATGDPFRTLIARVSRIMDAHAGDPMWRAACRGMVLFALGAMHGSRRRVTHHGARPPREAEGIREQADGSYVWFQWEESTWPEMSHPEWTSTIWARARCRLLDAPGKQGALHLPARTVVALRTDAVYTTHEAGWIDSGKLGAYRLKATYPGGPWPRSGADIISMKKASK